MALALTGTFVLSGPRVADAVVGTGVCTASMTLDFTFPISATSLSGNSVSWSGSGSCVGLVAGPISFSGVGAVPVDGPVSCEVFGATTSIGSLNFHPVTAAGAGAMAAQTWTFVPTTFTGAVAATGQFVWADTGQIKACESSGIQQVTLTGTLEVVTT